MQLYLAKVSMDIYVIHAYYIVARYQCGNKHEAKLVQFTSTRSGQVMVSVAQVGSSILGRWHVRMLLHFGLTSPWMDAGLTNTKYSTQVICPGKIIWWCFVVYIVVL